jgi:hypothetical protein
MQVSFTINVEIVCRLPKTSSVRICTSNVQIMIMVNAHVKMAVFAKLFLVIN